MAYCTITAVQRLNPTRTYDASSKPTNTQVESLIDDIAGEIDTLIAGRGISTPVTTPAELLRYLQYVNALGAAAEAESAMMPGSHQKRTNHYQELRDKYEKALEFLRTNPLSGSVIYPFSWASENQDDYEAEGLPHFQHDQVF